MDEEIIVKLSDPPVAIWSNRNGRGPTDQEARWVQELEDEASNLVATDKRIEESEREANLAHARKLIWPR